MEQTLRRAFLLGVGDELNKQARCDGDAFQKPVHKGIMSADQLKALGKLAKSQLATRNSCVAAKEEERMMHPFRQGFLDPVEGMEKRAAASPGLLTSDAPKHFLTDKEYAEVKRKFPWYRRTGPGLLLLAASGAAVGSMSPSLFGRGKLSGIGALVGMLGSPGLAYLVARSNRGQKQAKAEARRLLAKARDEKKGIQ